MQITVDTARVVFVFPGAGVEPCGHEAQFLARHRSLMTPFLEEASEEAGVRLTDVVENGGIQSLDSKTNELLTHAFNGGVCEVYKQSGITPFATAGHSLGVYSAVFASGATSFTDSLLMVTQARSLVGRECNDGQYGMATVVGLTMDEIEAILEKVTCPSICVANRNNITSTVLSGRRDALERILEQATELGAFKANFLDINMPYHNPRFLAHASSDLREFLGGLSWRKPQCPVVSSIDRTFLASLEQIVDFTARNLSTQIKWQRVVEAFQEHKATVVIECGPGISLTQNARFVADSPPHVNIKTSKRKLGI
jgi:[acyl-carrier-protein] S-malonyltransferase